MNIEVDLVEYLWGLIAGAAVALIVVAICLGRRRGLVLREGPNRRRPRLPDTSPGRRPASS